MVANARALSLALALTLAAGEARAFVCTRVTDTTGAETGPSVSWFVRRIPYTLHEGGTARVAGDGEFPVLRASFATWTGVTSCRSPTTATDLDLVESATLSATDRIGYDFVDPGANENLIIFRDDGWPIPGQEGTVVALTTVTYVPLTGQILDADIELNSSTFPFTIDPDPPQWDLMNAAVHEIGHFLGLAHSTDAQATMFDTARSGESSKRTLECDDRDAITFKYPAGAANGYCEPVIACGLCAPPEALEARPTIEADDADDGTGGCGCAAGCAPSGLALVALALLRRARRRR